MVLEVLHRSLVLFRCSPRTKRPEIAALAGPRILLAGIQPVLPRFQLADHCLALLPKEERATSMPVTTGPLIARLLPSGRRPDVRRCTRLRPPSARCRAPAATPKWIHPAPGESRSHPHTGILHCHKNGARPTPT